MIAIHRHGGEVEWEGDSIRGRARATTAQVSSVRVIVQSLISTRRGFVGRDDGDSDSKAAVRTSGRAQAGRAPDRAGCED